MENLEIFNILFNSEIFTVKVINTPTNPMSDPIVRSIPRSQKKKINIDIYVVTTFHNRFILQSY